MKEVSFFCAETYDMSVLYILLMGAANTTKNYDNNNKTFLQNLQNEINLRFFLCNSTENYSKYLVAVCLIMYETKLPELIAFKSVIDQ